jgi:hypothetical protein
MNQSYYTYRIRVTNLSAIRAERYGPNYEDLGEISGFFDYEGHKERIRELHKLGYEGNLKSDEVEDLGECLFRALLDERIRLDFFQILNKARSVNSLLRIEIDLDEGSFPELAALPWEFMRVPSEEGYSETWLATAPDLIFSRRRAFWTPPSPINLRDNERLRVALAVAAPAELGPVKYKKVHDALIKIEKEDPDRFEILGLIHHATKETIDELLAKKPHIFHFIGHGQFANEQQRQGGQIALFTNKDLDDFCWIDAKQFGELFNRHKPGIVVLQACEGAKSSDSTAFVGLASRVVQQDIPVVVAMQYEVSNSTARKFVLKFYQCVSKCEPVDKAVQEGRRRIAMEEMGHKTRDFATPVLFMRVKDGHLFVRPDKLESLDESIAARVGLDAIVEIMRVPEVRESAIAYKTAFQTTRERIIALGDCKDLHDEFHDFQNLCYKSIHDDFELFPDDKAAHRRLGHHQRSFRTFVSRFREIASRASFCGREDDWLQDVTEAEDELQAALDRLDEKKLKGFLLTLRTILNREPSRINTRMNEAAKNLSMKLLTKALDSICEKLRTGPDNLRELENARRIENGLKALRDLDSNLYDLIEEHDSWQRLEDELCLHGARPQPDMEELSMHWPKLDKKAERLYAKSDEQWATSIKKECDNLRNALEVRDLSAITHHFGEFQWLASERFYRVDKNLKELCENLRELGDNLNTVLESLGG